MEGYRSCQQSKHLSHSDGFTEQGSTITQQLAKNIYFTQDKKIVRKVAEIFMAFSIESNYNKNEILELYLNTSYFGNGFYSVKSASLGYFNKLPKDVNRKIFV